MVNFLQDSILPDSEHSLNSNLKLINIVVDNETIWPNVPLDLNGPSLQQQFDELEKDYCCSTCNKLHAVSPPTYEPSNRTTFSCVTCGKLFTNVVELYMHNGLDHSNEECHLPIMKKGFCNCNNILPKERPQKKKKPKKVRFKVKCDYCDKEFPTKQILERHINAVHLELKPHKCDICDKDFARKHECDQHIKNVHETVKRFECDECHKIFDKRCRLKHHVALVHDMVKDFECGYCEKRFGLKSDLERHESAVHLKSKTVACGFCDKAFARLDNLQRHIEKVHEAKKVYKCDQCTQYETTFERKKELNAHIKLVHTVKVEKKIPVCELCKNEFEFNSQLKRHEIICKKKYAILNQLKK